MPELGRLAVCLALICGVFAGYALARLNFTLTVFFGSSTGAASASNSVRA